MSLTGLKVERITSLEENELETVWLQIHPYRSNRPILTGAVYRPPSSTADTDARLELNIEAAYLRNQEIHVFGDFNMNFFEPSYKKHGLTKALNTTCLDHIYTTHPGFIADISVPNIGVSDHLPVFIRRKYSRKQKNQIHSTIEYRDLKNLNTDELLQDLQCTPWDAAFVFDDINDVLSSIETILNDVLDRRIPLKSKGVKRPNQPVWMTKEILQSMKTRDKLLNKARNSNLPEDWSRFTHAKRQTTNVLRKTKRSFFREKIDENKGNTKGVWKALKSLSGTSKPRVRINEITTENEVVSDESVVANELNEYFVNILEQICNNNDAGVDFENTKLKNFVHSRLNVDTVYNIPLLTIKQTIAIIDKISSNKASGYDGLSLRVLKKIAPVFANTKAFMQIT